MKREERLNYKKLVIGSLRKKTKDSYALVEDVYVTWRSLNSSKRSGNHKKGLKLIKKELITDILPEMVDDGEIVVDFGGYSLPGKQYERA